MARVFEKAFINKLEVANRLVRSATWEGMCEPDGRPTTRLIDYYRTLAEGGVGLIISGYAFVRPEGKQLPGKMGIWTDDFAAEYQQMTRAVHDAGGRIMIQLVHAGGQADEKSSGYPAVAPSAVKAAQFSSVPVMLSVTDIKEIVDAFAHAAFRARTCGFDGVQIHGAHGYLVSQFLSPLTNRRTDAYGGSLENRSRFLSEVYEKIRTRVGSSYPVCIKLNASDHLEGGFAFEEALVAAQTLSSKGIDAIEVSSGTGASGAMGPARTKILSPDREAYNLEFARAVQKKVTCPVMVVGGFRSYETVEAAIETHGIDFVSLSRPLIREPSLPARWEKGDVSPAECISCNQCFRPGLVKGGIYCVPLRKKES